MAMNGIDRRDFLKGTGWMGLAAVAAGCQTGKAVALHSSTLAWRIPWMEEPGGLQSMGWLRVGHH